MRLFGAGSALAMRPSSAQWQIPTPKDGTNMTGVEPDKVLLKDYRPKSIFRIQVTAIPKAKFPVIDAHCHGARPLEFLPRMVEIMDAAGVEKTIIFTGAANGARFQAAARPYLKYKGRFDLWCNLDWTGSDTPGYGPAAVKALEECHSEGAVGVGEITDKGMGLGHPVGDGPAGWPGAGNQSKTMGPHPDDPRMDAIWDKCAQLGMPINMHVSNIIWVYYPMDNQNDGMMNSLTWRLDNKPGIMRHDELIESMDNMLTRHPKTTYIFCHFANLDYDYNRLGQLLDRHANMYVDISAQYCESSATPRATIKFYTKYADRILYGTDMTYHPRMFATTFRILESLDEHFYEQDLFFNFDYHWPMSGFGLPDDILRKVYNENARAVYQKARAGAA